MAALLAALLLAAAPSDTHGRLALSAGAGGGWATDPYLGAGIGRGPMVDVASGARLDLCFSPAVKAAAAADASWLAFRTGDFEARMASAAGEVRVVGRGTEAALGIAGDVARYPTGAPSGEGAEGPVVSRTATLAVTPAVRLRSGRLLGWASATGHVGSSRTVNGDVGERGFAAALGGSFSPRDRMTAFASLHASHVASPDDAFAFRSGGAETGMAFRPLGALDVTARLAFDHTRFDTGVHEDLIRGGVELVHPVGPISAVVAWSAAHSDAGERGTHHRQLVYGGVRGRFGVASW